MPRTRSHHMHCSIARTLDVLGGVWGALVLRDVGFGVRRFDEMHRDLGVASNVLSSRLAHLREQGVVKRVRYPGRPRRYEDVATERGKELLLVLLAMLAFGDRFLGARGGPPVRLRHEGCGRIAWPRIVCDACEGVLVFDEVTVLAGPGAKTAPGTMVLPSRLPPGAPARGGRTPRGPGS